MKYTHIIILVLISLTGCKKFIVTEPPLTEIANDKVFSNDLSATSAMNGIYSELVTSFNFIDGGPNGINYLCALSADEMDDLFSRPNPIQTNSIQTNDGTVSGAIWAPGYKYIWYVNSLLEGIAQSSNLSENIKKQLEGEAKFIRAICNFYLTNLFGPIPIVTVTDYKVNSILPRSPQSEVYQMVVQDLLDAQSLLAGDYSYSSGERVKPNKDAATAMLARVYLFTGEWAKAEAQASAIINNTTTFHLETDLNKAFLYNTQEAIWQLKPALPGYNTNDGMFFIERGGYGGLLLLPSMLNAFEPGDKRRTDWITSYTRDNATTYYPYKYKVGAFYQPVTEYPVMLRLSEQYLIRAEARIQQPGKIADGIADLNVIRTRARQAPTVALPNPLPALSLSLSKTDAMMAVENERIRELFTEGGHRWLDLKRWKRADAVLAPVKGINWQATDTLYPVPLSELQTNQHLLPQNQGY